jgi:hypothetical protein
MLNLISTGHFKLSFGQKDDFTLPIVNCPSLVIIQDQQRLRFTYHIRYSRTCAGYYDFLNAKATQTKLRCSYEGTNLILITTKKSL